MTLIANVFLKLRSPKNVITYMSEKSIFRGPFHIQHVISAQTLLQSDRQQRYNIK